MLNGFSPIVIIEGEQQMGKSFYAIWLSYVVCNILEKKYDLNRHTAYDPKQAMKMLNDLTGEPAVLQESAYAFHFQEYYKKPNIIFSKIIITQGRKVLLYIFCSPKESDIDKKFRKHFHIKIKVIRRRIAKIYYIKNRKKLDDIGRFMDDVELDIRNFPRKIWEDFKLHDKMEKERIKKELDGELKIPHSEFKKVLKSI